jgi:valyl-tRNA synthetase
VENQVGIAWFESRLNQSIVELNDHFNKFRMSDALLTVYKLAWDDFCAWYLEIIKPEFGKPIDQATYTKTIEFFETILKLLHPFMPFITEELWHELGDRKEKDCIIVSAWPKAGAFEEKIIEKAATAFEIVAQIRNTRNSKGISPKEALSLVAKPADRLSLVDFLPVTQKMANLRVVEFNEEKPESGVSFMVGSIEFSIPLNIDKGVEKLAMQKELDYARGFLDSINKKLANEKFVKGAPPHVLEMENKKKTDAELKIRSLEKTLAELKSHSPHP